MDIVGSSSASGGDGCAEEGELVDLISQDQHSHGGSCNNVSGMAKKHEISSSYVLQSIRADGSGNHYSGTNLDGVAGNLESGGSVLGSDTMTQLSKSLEPHEQQKVICEMGRKAYDVATVREIDRTMKKYADNILHTLEGVSSRLVQLESKTQQLETSVDELMNNSDSANGKLSQLENILREVETGIQVLRNKQEISRTQPQHSKLQQSLKQDQTPSPPEKSKPTVSNQATQHSQQSIQPPLPPAPPLQARISLSSPPPHSHHAPNKSLPLQSQNHQLPQYPPQTPSPKVYPHIICQQGTVPNERRNAVKRKCSSSYVDEECVEDAVHIVKRIGGKRWDENDQVNLARAWSCISNSAKNGVNGDERSFWRGVMKEYNANYCTDGFRSVYGLKNYWKLLKKQCFLWKKVLSNFDFQTGGDSSSDDLMKDVKTKFKSVNMGRKFEYKAAYEILKDCPKWCAIEVGNMDLEPSAKRTCADTSEESSEASIPSGSNANIPTCDMHSTSPHKFVLEESNEKSTTLPPDKSQHMDSLPVMICDMSKITPESRVLSREEVES